MHSEVHQTIETTGDYRRDPSWQRAMDIMVALHSATSEMGQRDFDELGKPLWEANCELVRELGAAHEVTCSEERGRCYDRARAACARLHSQLLLCRQLRIIDIEQEHLRQIERIRRALASSNHPLST